MGRAFDGTGGGMEPGSARNLIARTAQGTLIVALSCGLLWLVAIYASALRDPRYLDGWVLAGGMIVQMGLHVARTTVGLSPGSDRRWRRTHVLVGYVLMAAFVSHCDFSLPDTGLEWALWLGFVLMASSGVLGTYLDWSLKAKGRVDERLAHDRIPDLRAGLARDVEALVAETDSDAARIALPGLPYDTWIADLHATHLRDFFSGPRNVTAHLVGSRRPLERITDEIDNLSPFLDAHGQERLAAIRRLAIEKDRLDLARVHLGLTRGWLHVHVSVAYSLLVLSATHVIVVYAFSSGTW